MVGAEQLLLVALFAAASVLDAACGSGLLSAAHMGLVSMKIAMRVSGRMMQLMITALPVGACGQTCMPG